MAGRYKQIIKAEKKLYLPDIPVMVLAYAILHDLKENKYLVQIKYENCSDRTITGLVVSLVSFNQLGEVIERVTDYHYIGQNASPGESFGSQSAIRLTTDIVPQKVDIIIKDIVFTDGEANVIGDLSPVVEIPELVPLESSLKPELGEEYRSILNSKMRYTPSMKENSWFCACGAYNVECDKCVECGSTKTDVFLYLNPSILEESILNKKYEKALALINEGSIESITSAEEIFKSLHDYKDAADKSLECQQIIEEKQEAINRANAKKEEKRKRETIVIVSLAVAALICFFIVKSIVIPNNKYNEAMRLIKEKDYVAAYKTLEELKDYKDSKEKKKSILVEYEIEMIRRSNEYDSVEFGEYEQDDIKENGKERLKWIVLSKDDDSALLLSEYGIENKLYNETNSSFTWENCTIRTWLNDTFLQEAFSNEEMGRMYIVNVDGLDLPDGVFIMAARELDKYYSDGVFCKPTQHAINAGCFYSENTGNCIWWSRALYGTGKQGGAYYDMDGDVHSYSELDEGVGVAVRPAIYVDLRKK